MAEELQKNGVLQLKSRASGRRIDIVGSGKPTTRYYIPVENLERLVGWCFMNDIKRVTMGDFKNLVRLGIIIDSEKK